jgi:hypothetical protein
MTVRELIEALLDMDLSIDACIATGDVGATSVVLDVYETTHDGRTVVFLA